MRKSYQNDLFKKLAICFIIICIPLILTACGEKKEDTGNQTSSGNIIANTVELTGYISEVDLLDTSKDHLSPYLFKSSDSNNSEFYLENDKNVSFSSWLNKNVTIVGYFENKDNKLFYVTSVKNVDESNMVGKKEYYNVTLGLGLFYPNEWNIKKIAENKVVGEITTSKQFIFSIEKIANPKNQSISSFISTNYKTQNAQDVIVGTDNGAGYMAKLVISGTKETTIVSNSDAFYVFSYEYVGTGQDASTIKDKYTALIGSIKLINSSDNSETTANTASDNSDVSFTAGGTGSINVNSNSSDNNSAPVNGTVNPINNGSASSTNTSLTPTTSSSGSTTSTNTSTTTTTSPSSSTSPTSTSTTTTPSTIATTTTTTTTSNNSGDTSQNVIRYIKGNTSVIPTDSGNAKVTQVEFAGSDYVYVTYKDGDSTKKVLYSYSDNGGNVSVSQQGNFKLENGKWTTVSGVNKAAQAARTVYSLDSTGGVKAKAEVSKGKTLYEGSGIDAQIPRDWYYENKGSTIVFSNKPGDSNPDKKVEVAITKNLDTSNATKTTINGKDAYVITDSSGATKYAVKGASGKYYVASGTDNGSVVDVLGTIEEK